MPAIDDCEPQIIRAFAKLGWALVRRSFPLRMNSKMLYADLLLQQTQTEASLIVVEVKCFPERGSHINQFYTAIGQYFVYRLLLEKQAPDIRLVLAIPLHIYQTLVSQQAVLGQLVEKYDIGLAIVNLQNEEVASWEQ